MGRRWRGIITQRNVQLPATPPAAGEESPTPRIFEQFSWREPPLTLRAVFEDEGAHNRAAPVARIDRIWEDGDDIWAEGVFSDVPDGKNAETLAAEKILDTVSVDPSDYAYVEEWIDPRTGLVVPEETLAEARKAFIRAIEEEDEDRQVELMDYFDSLYVRLRFPRYEIGGATLCAIQAVTRARIEVLDGDAPAEETPTAEDLQASAVPVLDVGRLMIDPTIAPRFRTYGELVAAETDRAAVLQASVGPATRPAAWYARQNLDGPTPFSISDDGRISGHLACWGECHRGIQSGTGECVTPPRQDDFREFHTGEVALDDGTRMRVGILTYADLHAETGGLSVAEIQRLMEDTGRQLGTIRLYADEYGIQACGATHDDVPADDVARCLAGGPSGDWRAVPAGSPFRLYGVHIVNTRGFTASAHESIDADGSRRLVASFAAALPILAAAESSTSGCSGGCGCDGTCSTLSADDIAAELADADRYVSLSVLADR